MSQSALLPFPPSTNILFVNVPGKGRIKSEVYKKWLNEAGWALLAQRMRPVGGAVRVTIRAVRPDKRRRDIDNLIKAVLDLLVRHKMIEDDSSVEVVTAQWVGDNIAGLSVTVEAIGEQAAKQHKTA